jgi:class 3 adenylate cyclase
MASPVERKLTTIFSADAAGYSRLMADDERAAFDTLKSRRSAMEGLIAAHGGRLVNSAGDSILVEFGSVVKAVECAIAIQRDMAERNAGLTPERQMWFRVGINLGDVMVSNGDLFGDGVNVAARLQALADPGGILVSGQVHDLVQDKLAVGFGYLGDRTVKNITKEVPVYRVLLKPDDAEAALAPQPVAALLAGPARTSGFQHDLIVNGGRAALIIAVLFAINLFAGGDTWWFQWPALPILAIFGLRTLSLYQKYSRKRP